MTQITDPGDIRAIIEQVAADAGLTIPAEMSDWNAIIALATEAGVALPAPASDQNMIEAVAALIGAGYISCIQLLSALLADAQAVQPLATAVPTVSGDQLTASYSVVGSLGDAAYLAAGVVGAAGGLTYQDITGGVHGVQLDVGAFPALLSNPGVAASLILMNDTPALLASVSVVVSATYASGYQIWIQGDGAPIQVDVAGKPNSIGMEVDHAGGTVAVKADGVVIGSTTVTSNGTAAMSGIQLIEFSGNDNAGDVGKTYAVSPVTNAQDMDAAQFSAGTMDLCGNEIT